MNRYVSTGRGGHFFNKLYGNAYSVETIRKHPSSIEELKEFGLSDTSIAEYFLLIKRLYGEAFLEQNMLLPKIGTDNDFRVLWNQLYHFYLSHSLILEYKNENGEAMPAEIPDYIASYKFIHQTNKYPGVFHVTTLEEYRYDIETQFADLPEDWYLSLRYDIHILYELGNDIEYLARYSKCVNKLIPLSETDANNLLTQIHFDIEEAKLKIAQHNNTTNIQQDDNHNEVDNKEKLNEFLKLTVGDKIEMRKRHPCGSNVFTVIRCGSNIRIECRGCGRSVIMSREKFERSVKKVISDSEESAYLKSCEAFDNWFKIDKELDYEIDKLSECADMISEIINTGVQSIQSNYQYNILYVHKGIIKCQSDDHHIEQATAILLDRYGNDIELNVNHCLDCNIFYIHYDIYQHYLDKYGIILGNLQMVKDGSLSNNNINLAEKSPLKLCGYSVSQKDGQTKNERQKIIEYCIESGVMTKAAVINHLRWFIKMNGAKIGNEMALQKWREDLDFVLSYDVDKQNKYYLGNIMRYSKNRFISNTK